MIFGEFAPVSQLGIKSFDSRPEPEPDILCCLETGEQLAFELTRVDDPDVIQKDQTEFDLTQKLMAARDGLVDLESLRGWGIRVNFQNCKFRESVKFIPKVIETLNDNGPGGCPWSS